MSGYNIIADFTVIIQPFITKEISLMITCEGKCLI